MTVRVLVVDDEPDVEALFRQQFRREVRQELHTLDFALSGTAALDILDGHIGAQIILLVSDINMPGMTGLRRPEHHRHCPGARRRQVPDQAGGFSSTEAGYHGDLPTGMTTTEAGGRCGQQDRRAANIWEVTSSPHGWKPVMG